MHSFCTQHILVMQEDNFVPTLSVWETLKFTTDLRLPSSFSKEDKEVLMNEALDNMGLQKVKHSQASAPAHVYSSTCTQKDEHKVKRQQLHASAKPTSLRHIVAQLESGEGAASK